MLYDLFFAFLQTGNYKKAKKITEWCSGKESVRQCMDSRDVGLIQGWEDPLEKEMATPSSVLAWRIPRTGDHMSMGSQRGGHNRLSISTIPQREVKHEVDSH